MAFDIQCLADSPLCETGHRSYHPATGRPRAGTAPTMGATNAVMKWLPEPTGGYSPPRRHNRLLPLLLLALLCASAGGCATIRVTDPEHSATEQFLLTGAASEAVSQLSMDGIRDQVVFLNTEYLTATTQPAYEHSFLIGELRARLLKEGVRLAAKRESASVVIEVRSGGVGIDRLEYLLGIPSGVGTALAGTGTAAPIAAPELAIVKSTKQRGFASVAIVAYRAGDGSLIAQSGPFVGRTARDDYWIFGTGPRTVGNIPPAEK